MKLSVFFLATRALSMLSGHGLTDASNVEDELKPPNPYASDNTNNKILELLKNKGRERSRINDID